MQTLRRNTLIELPVPQTFEPERDFIVLEPIKYDAVSPGGVRFQEGFQETCAGVIVRMGPGLRGQNDEIIPPLCKLGQAVVLNPQREIMELKEGRRTYYVAGSTDVVGVIKDYAPPVKEEPAPAAVSTDGTENG